jgi:hypothetical protein
MKTLKIKMEYEFNVPSDTKIVKDDFHGIFIVNKKHNINSKLFLEGYEMDFDERDERGGLIRSSMSYDGGKLSDFLFNEGYVNVESDTIKLGNKKMEYIIS